MLIYFVNNPGYIIEVYLNMILRFCIDQNVVAK